MKRQGDGLAWLGVVIAVLWMGSVLLLVGLSGRAQAQMISGERWLLMGDSIQATVVEQAFEPSADSLAAAIVQREAPVTVQNLSVPGAGVYRDWESQRSKGDSLKGYRAKGLIITLGTNDYGTGQDPSKVYMYYKYLVLQAREAGLKVVCVTPIWRRGEATPKTETGYPLSEYRRQIKGACLGGGGQVIAGESAPLADLRYFGDDSDVGLHLNTEGHKVFAKFLLCKMRELGYWK